LILIVDDSVEIPTRYSFVIEFIIPKFIEGSTCFAASGLYTFVVTGRCHSALVMAGHYEGIKIRGRKYCLELLMMSGVPLETC
jgi:hypothetical protein